jgi:hypothetical protein
MFGDNAKEGVVSDSVGCAVILRAGNKDDKMSFLQSICSGSEYEPKSTRGKEEDVAILDRGTEHEQTSISPRPNPSEALGRKIRRYPRDVKYSFS